MIFEIINPSDPYTLECDDLEIASVTVCFLGQGQYGMHQIDGDKEFRMPIFLFGGENEWFKENFGDNADVIIGRCFKDKKLQLADALDSVRIGGINSRGKSKDEHNENRSSVNDIGGVAWEYAKFLRAKVEGEADAN